MIGEFKFMDLLYSRYTSPMDLIRLYINRGRFGEFVRNVIDAENERIREQAEKEDNWKLWFVYINSGSDESFIAWKKRILGGSSKRTKESDYDLTDDGIKSIIDSVFEQ